MTPETILIAGASADIGLALAARLARRESARLVLHSHRGSARLTTFAGQLGSRALDVSADLSTSNSCAAMADTLDGAGWRPTHLVHIPALPFLQVRFPKFDWCRFEKDMNVQVGALVHLLGRWLPTSTDGPGLRRVVVVSSSVTNGRPPKYVSMYTSVKYAQLGLVRSINAEYADRGVVINSVSPSMVDSRFLAGISPKAVELNAAANPRRRNATPDEIADIIEWLLFATSYISGADLPVTGGA